MADDETPKPAKPARTRAAAAKPDDATKPAKPARTRAAAAKTDTTKPARTSAAAAKTDEAPAKPARTARTRTKAPAAEVATQAPDATATAPTTPARRAAQPAKSPAPAPARTRRAAPLGPITVRAHARYVRSSARKARLVCNHIRGKSVPEARALLAFAPRGVAKDWAKLLDSAVANAENNHELIGDELRVTAVYADEGPTLKRFTPRAMGRATPIHKRTSHLTIELGNKE
jgi:ribosomal protein L22